MPSTTEAYVVHEAGGRIKLETVHYKDPGAREILVEAVAASMCHTDIRAAQGGFFLKPPMILGHEASGFGTSPHLPTQPSHQAYMEPPS